MHAHVHRLTPVCSLLLSLTFIYKRVYIDPLTLETQVNSHMHTYTHRHKGESMHPWELQPGDPAWDRDQRHREPEDQEKRDGEKERERREIKTSQRAGARLRAGKGVRARGSLSQALIMGGRAGAEGSLFEVCGEKHQRERREASRE